MEKIAIPYPIIVEGKYDKIKLSSLIDGDIFTTEGFRIFNNEEKKQLIKSLAKITPIIILTDSDGGGNVIRQLFKRIIPVNRQINLYIPEIKGKERRKEKASKEGMLGVEGIDAEVLKSIFLPYASGEDLTRRGGILKKDLYEAGLSGRDNSAEKRALLAKRLGFPENISANSFLAAINILYTREDFFALLSK